MDVAARGKRSKTIQCNISDNRNVGRLHYRVCTIKPIKSRSATADAETTLSCIRRHNDEIDVKPLFERAVPVARCQAVEIAQELIVAL